jgi:hypothetical protein
LIYWQLPYGQLQSLPAKFEETIRMLDAIAGVLLRCFIIAVIALLFVWPVYFAMGDFLHQV